MRICANVQQHINMIKMTTMVMTMIYSTQFNVAKIKQLSWSYKYSVYILIQKKNKEKHPIKMVINHVSIFWGVKHIYIYIYMTYIIYIIDICTHTHHIFVPSQKTDRLGLVEKEHLSITSAGHKHVASKRGKFNWCLTLTGINLL